ncbi:hypothetical protein BGZ91_001952 [Linnemannia elongata]|nr:hypothetical protein BGZ91_001952 [Linnemannia elongata]
MNSDDKVFYEADDGDSLAPDVEESEKPDYKEETYEPEDENSLGSEDETEYEDNSKATRGDITSSERFNCHGGLDFDDDDDDQSADMYQDDSDYLLNESDSGVDSAGLDDDDGEGLV